MLKKRLLLLLCVVGLIFSMMSCGGVPEKEAEKQENEDKTPVSEEQTSEGGEQDDETQKPEETDDEPSNDEPEENGTEGKEPERNEGNETNQGTTNPKPPETSSGVASSNWSSADLTAEEIEALLNDPYMILVNRQNKITADFEPMDMTTYAGYKLNKTCANALRRMINAGKSAGYNYVLYSGYRTYDTQYNKYYNKIASYKNQGYSEEKAIELTDQYYAQPGASEHHTGLAADVCIPRIVNQYGCLHENYDQTPEFKWFSSHAHEYGFILRYGKTQKSITGYNYEPWHYRYVGVDVASEIYRRGITYEEFIWELEDRLEQLKK